MIGFDNPSRGQPDRAVSSVRIPAVGAAWLAVTAGSPGPWTEVEAAAPNDQLIIAVNRAAGTFPKSPQYDIGIGPACSEVVQEVAAMPNFFPTIGGWGRADLPRKVRVLAGERLAIRCTSSGAAPRHCVVKVIDL